ncbi:Ragulator complex protein [Schistosoma japonicum]|uniref:Ragulator complex protein n=1 Tax=Schistosoma japonicum TaxID=6182 RepID=A0A4Z2CVH4_SCHJA|nr:Ragulator complex protein LAMTOR2 [Schistosoma japonicum]TNN08215.1 Ragulator complex protein [Schistosoma japonicum]
MKLSAAVICVFLLLMCSIFQMLRPRALTSALRKMNTGGIKSVMVFNPEGVLLAHTSLAGDSERSRAAIAANIWNIYQRQLESSESDIVQEIILELTEGRLIITRVASVLLCLHASKEVGLGMLRAKMNALAQNLQEPLSLISAS